MKKYKSLKFVLLSLLLLFSFTLLNPSSSLAAKSFSDLNSKDSHYEGITYLNGLNVYDYKSGNKFNGNNAVSRAEVSKILFNLYSDDFEIVRQYKNSFKDVSLNTEHAFEIIWAYEVGIFDGNGNESFGPNDKLTRAQMSKILVNSFNLKSKGTYTLKDVKSSHWAFNYVSILYGNGITVGDGKGNYLPNNKVTLSQLSSFIYRTIQLDSAPTVVKDSSDFGIASKSSLSFNSEYNFNWNVIDLGKGFELEGVTNNKVVARYKTSVGSSLSLSPDVKIGVSSKSEVINLLGNPLSSILKGNTQYSLGSSVGKEYGLYLLDDYYVYFFYDLHNSSKVRSILAIDKDFETEKEGFYGSVSKLEVSRDSSENLMVLLMNEARESAGLNSLTSSNSSWSNIGRAHSKDMALNNYFSHNSLNGSSPFDRMLNGGMSKASINWWGENLAYGQFNSIFSHEALMNSKGHRDNILHESFTHSFVGLEYNSKKVPYYTIGFYSLR